MSDLVAFIRARLDEDEQAAKLVQQPYRLYVSADGRLAEPLRIDDLHGEHDGEYQQWPEGDDRMPNHITNWSLVYDPDRMLREVEAKRQRLSRYEAALAAWEAAYAAEQATYPDPPSIAVRKNNQAWAVLQAWKAAVTLDALPYADYPD